jgi:hypothetical protein
MSRPAYQVFNIDLSNVSGLQVIPGRFNWLRYVFAADVNGNFNPQPALTVALGRASGDPIPLGVNGLIRGETDDYYVRWTPQNFVATLVLAYNLGADGIYIEAPPAKQLVTPASATLLTTAQVVVGSSATLISAGGAFSVSRTIKNNGSAILFLGPIGVTTLTGFAVAPGDAFTLSGNTAPVYGVSAAGGLAVSVLSEG